MTVFVTPTRHITVCHPPYMKVGISGDNTLIISYDDKCTTCYPQMLFLEDWNDDLLINLTTKTDIE